MDTIDRDQLRPPSLFETLLLPLAGPVIVAAVHTKRNELLLFVLPIPFILVRLLIQGWQRRRTEIPDAPISYRRWMGGSFAVDALAGFVLAFFEMGAVLMMSPGRPPESGWYVVEGLYVAYVLMRLLGRVMWVRAVESL
jgi:hypothetical protein